MSANVNIYIYQWLVLVFSKKRKRAFHDRNSAISCVKRIVPYKIEATKKEQRLSLKFTRTESDKKSPLLKRGQNH
ncbi:hypothetical protein ZX61_04850 [Vibrio sp. VPAP30]|nr:hypothetical protein ZX61_04850 [Vibrio sp. VPAP30]